MGPPHSLPIQIPIMGKHTKPVTCGAWNIENLIAMGSEDLSMTVSSGIDGDTVKTLHLKMEPHEIKFNRRKVTDGDGDEQEDTVSINVGQRSIYLLSVRAPGLPPMRKAPLPGTHPFPPLHSLRSTTVLHAALLLPSTPTTPSVTAQQREHDLSTGRSDRQPIPMRCRWSSPSWRSMAISFGTHGTVMATSSSGFSLARWWWCPPTTRR